MITELISVGTEILLGNIVNTNSAYLSEKCAELGLSVYYQTVVGDNETRMRETIQTALDRSDIVILTGGLGPTEDDLTKEVTAEVMGMKLVEDRHSRKLMEAYLEQYKKNNPQRKITANNYKQAMVPKGAIVLNNHNGTAPGLILEKKGKTAILLPGPPGEMKPMFEESVFPYLRKKQPEIIYSQMVKICSIGESQVAEEIEDLIESQTNPTIAPYAKTGEVHLRITAKGKNEKECKKLIKPVVKELKARFGRNIFATEDFLWQNPVQAVRSPQGSSMCQALLRYFCRAWLLTATKPREDASMSASPHLRNTELYPRNVQQKWQREAAKPPRQISVFP